LCEQNRYRKIRRRIFLYLQWGWWLWW
jgi:hypothetical protein